MNFASDINSVIETLCEKFGLAWGEATKLVPEIIRYGQLRAMLIGMICALGILISLIMILLTLRTMRLRRAQARDQARAQARARARAQEQQDPDSWYNPVHEPSENLFYYGDVGTNIMPVFAVGIILLIMSFGGLILSALDGLTWATAPNFAAVQFVLNML